MSKTNIVPISTEQKADQEESPNRLSFTLEEMLEEFDNGAVPRSKYWRELITALYDTANHVVTGVTAVADIKPDNVGNIRLKAEHLYTPYCEDVIGRSLFYGNACKVQHHHGGYYEVSEGSAYIAGIYFFYTGTIELIINKFPNNVWLDVSWSNYSLSVKTPVIIALSSQEELEDYYDSNQIKHYVEKLSVLDSSGLLSDVRNTQRKGTPVLKQLCFNTIKELQITKKIGLNDVVSVIEMSHANYEIVSKKNTQLLSGDIDLNSDYIAKLLQIPGGGWFIEHFGGSKTPLDIQPAMQRAIERCVQEGEIFTIYFGDGEYFANNTFDFSQVKTEFSIRGKGRRITRLLVGKFGCTNFLFKLPLNTPCFITGFTIAGGEPEGKRGQHPIAIYAPDAGRVGLEDLGTGEYENTVIWCSRPFNCDWNNLDLFFSGFQYLYREIDKEEYRVSTTEGSDLIVANRAAFNSNDIGKDFYIQNDGSSNIAFVTKIISVKNSFEVIVDRAPHFTDTNRVFSFGSVKCSINQGSTSLKLDGNVLSNDDTGRIVYIEGAGDRGGVHISNISEVISSNSANISDPAFLEVNNNILHIAPSVVISGYKSVGNTPINDLVINNMLIEGQRGAALLVRGGTHIYFNNLKTHGRPSSEFSNFAYSGKSLVFSNTNRSVINTWEHEFGLAPAGEGIISVIGDSPQLEISGLTVNSMSNGDNYLFDFIPMNTQLSNLIIGNVQSRMNWSYSNGLVRTLSGFSKRKVIGCGCVTANNNLGMQSVQLPMVVGSTRSFPPYFINNDSFIAFTPATITGFLAISAEDSGACSTFLYFRLSDPSNVTILDTRDKVIVKSAVGSLDGTTGEDGKISISAVFEDQKIYVENRSGAGRRFYVGILG